MNNLEENLANEQNENKNNNSVSEAGNSSANLEIDLLKAQLEAENAVKEAIQNISKAINS